MTRRSSAVQQDVDLAPFEAHALTEAGLPGLACAAHRPAAVPDPHSGSGAMIVPPWEWHAHAWGSGARPRPERATATRITPDSPYSVTVAIILPAPSFCGAGGR